jgi:hypothetical protein
MRRIGGDVKKLDIDFPSAVFSRLSGTLRRIRQTRETWNLSFWGMKASREHVETTTEMADEVPHDRR